MNAILDALPFNTAYVKPFQVEQFLLFKLCCFGVMRALETILRRPKPARLFLCQLFLIQYFTYYLLLHIALDVTVFLLPFLFHSLNFGTCTWFCTAHHGFTLYQMVHFPNCTEFTTSTNIVFISFSLMKDTGSSQYGSS